MSVSISGQDLAILHQAGLLSKTQVHAVIFRGLQINDPDQAAKANADQPKKASA